MAGNPRRPHTGRGPPDPQHPAGRSTGETRLDNLVLLCRRHHRLVHEGGYAVTMQSGDTPVFTDPAGSVIPTGPDTRFRGNVTARNRQAGLTVGPQTPVPDWLGEEMDDSMAVEGLLQLE